MFKTFFYSVRHYSAAEKRDKLLQVISPARQTSTTTKSVPAQSSLSVYTSLLSPGLRLRHNFDCEDKKACKVYVHVVQSSGYNPGVAKGASVKVSVSGGYDSKGSTARESEVLLREGDGACVVSNIGTELTFENSGDRDAEVFVLRVS